MGIPPVIVILEVRLEFIVRREIDLAADQILVALVVRIVGEKRLREVKIALVCVKEAVNTKASVKS